MERNQLPKKEVKLNQYGNKVIENWCWYAEKKAKLARKLANKEVKVSNVTEKDQRVFGEALKRLKKERARKDVGRKRAIKRLSIARSFRSAISNRWIPRPNKEYVPCQIDYNKLKAVVVSNAAETTVKLEMTNSVRTKSKLMIKDNTTDDRKPKTPVRKGKTPLKVEKPKTPAKVEKTHEKTVVNTKTLVEIPTERPKSRIELVKLPPVKTKPWVQPAPPQRKPKPVVIIPPFKTRPWAPTTTQQRKPKPIIVIPPFKTRPWNPCLSKVKLLKRPVINYPPLKLRKS